jgi:hypothetical protein
MDQKLSFSLRLLAIFFFWYTAAFILSVLPLLEIKGALLPQLSFRGGAHVWDFEFFFMVIYFVWGIFLWKASNAPLKQKLFIDFTLWATLAHIFAMLVVGFIRRADLSHLLVDATALAIPLLLVTIFRFRLK